MRNILPYTMKGMKRNFFNMPEMYFKKYKISANIPEK